MCLALRSDQHIQLKFVYEQMWPRSDANGLTYHECFDIILRSFSEQPIERLFALSPFDGDFEVPAPDPKVGWAHTFHDWIFKNDPQRLTQSSTPVYELHFRAEETVGQNRFKATRLMPVVNNPNWLAVAPPKQVAALVGTDMTFKEISFTNGAAIQPFDPEREQETTYWIRLKLNGKPAGAGAPALFDAQHKPLFRVHPYCIFSPDDVISNLAAKFEALMQHPAMASDAANAKQAVIDKSLRKPCSSVQVMDHRISIVTGQHGVLVFNTHHEGACSFHAVEEITDGNNVGHLARNYFTGAEYFPNTDALTLARNALDYLRRYATTEATAKTKEEVTSAINGYHHPNVAHVIDVLKVWQYIEEESLGRFYANGDRDQRQLESPADAGADMLSRLYEPVNETKNGRRGFSPRGYRIDCDFAFTEIKEVVGEDLRLPARSSENIEVAKAVREFLQDDEASFSIQRAVSMATPVTTGGRARGVRVRDERTVRIFLASSSELKGDRDEFELYFRQQNDRLRDEGLYLKIVRWENFLDAMSERRLQDEYNRAVGDCDIFVSLFMTKTGKYTQEEFEVALETFKHTGKPLIYTFFKAANVSTSSMNLADLQSLQAFKDRLKTLGHYQTHYDGVEHLKRQFLDQLQKLRDERRL